MTLLRPSMLWMLLGVAALAAGYVVLQRRRRHFAVRFTHVDLLEYVVPRRPGWRRHLPAAVVGGGPATRPVNPIDPVWGFSAGGAAWVAILKEASSTPASTNTNTKAAYDVC